MDNFITRKVTIMKASFKTFFFLKKGNRYKGGPMPIYVRINVDGKRVEVSLQRSWEKSKWDQKKGRAMGTKAEAGGLNAYLETVQGSLYEIMKDAAMRHEHLTAQKVKQKLIGGTTERHHTLLEVYRYHNDQFKQLVGHEYSIGTLKKYESALRSVERFIEWKFRLDDVHLSEVNHKFITDYEFYLKTQQKVLHNTAMGNMKKLKKIIRQCVANDWMEKDPFLSYKISFKETNREFLLQDELDALINKDISIPRLEQVRDIFLFSCYTGLSYGDVINLSAKDVSLGIDGGEWIFTFRLKTDAPSRIPLLPMAKKILDKYSHNPKVVRSGKLLPYLTNQKLNAYLKEIADLCGIQKELTFHCARHTFATTVTLSNGVSIETVSKMLGHRSLRTTQIYAKILDSKVSEEMKQLRARLHKATEEKNLKAI